MDIYRWHLDVYSPFQTFCRFCWGLKVVQSPLFWVLWAWPSRGRSRCSKSGRACARSAVETRSCPPRASDQHDWSNQRDFNPGFGFERGTTGHSASLWGRQWRCDASWPLESLPRGASLAGGALWKTTMLMADHWATVQIQSHALVGLCFRMF